jgi:hypothetical protein
MATASAAIGMTREEVVKSPSGNRDEEVVFIV